MHACKRAGDVKGMKAAVLGAGPIGILLAQTLKAFGAEKVLVTDVSDFRLKLAKECERNTSAIQKRFCRILWNVLEKTKQM